MYQKCLLVLVSAILFSGTVSAENFGPLIEDCYWSAYEPYNKYAAEKSGVDDIYLGRGAVALAKIMFYYTAPPRPLRRVTYIDSLDSLHGEYSTFDVAWHDYDWINMPAQLSADSPSNETEAVCQLLYQAAVALHTNFERWSAEVNRNKILFALRQVFGMNSSLIFERSSYSDSQWLTMIRTSLSNGCPVLYISDGDNPNELSSFYLIDGIDTNDLIHLDNYWWYTLEDLGQKDRQLAVFDIRPFETILPEPPENVEASAGLLTNGVNISWSAIYHTIKYGVFRAEDGQDFAEAILIADDLKTTNYLDASAQPGIPYSYWVCGAVRAGWGEESDPATGYRQGIPAVPAGLQASDGLYTNKVMLTWADAHMANTYQVYRAETNIFSQAVLVAGNIQQTEWTDTDVIQNVGYSYWVTAGNEVGWSDMSPSDDGYAIKLVSPPEAPGNLLAVTSAVPGQVTVSWDRPAGAGSFTVYRATVSNAIVASVCEQTISGATWIDECVPPGVTMYYWGVARNILGSSPFSETAVLATAPESNPAFLSVPLATGNIKIFKKGSLLKKATHGATWQQVKDRQLQQPCFLILYTDGTTCQIPLVGNKKESVFKGMQPKPEKVKVLLKEKKSKFVVKDLSGGDLTGATFWFWQQTHK